MHRINKGRGLEPVPCRFEIQNHDRAIRRNVAFKLALNLGTDAIHDLDQAIERARIKLSRHRLKFRCR